MSLTSSWTRRPHICPLSIRFTARFSSGTTRRSKMPSCYFSIYYLHRNAPSSFSLRLSVPSVLSPSNPMPFDAIELSSVAIGGRVLSVSDEFFAEAYQLLLVEPAISLKGQFGPNGALYSGWETRRHNPDHDWCIIQLGTPGSIIGFDIDTSHFNGNEAPRASVDAFRGDTDEFPSKDDSRVIGITDMHFLYLPLHSGKSSWRPSTWDPMRTICSPYPGRNLLILSSLKCIQMVVLRDSGSTDTLYP